MRRAVPVFERNRAEARDGSVRIPRSTDAPLCSGIIHPSSEDAPATLFGPRNFESRKPRRALHE